ncbi:hypothetical protein BSKO_02666 [Bryopsis sp. KO-2023]|nr:hypothetical protein BSKO_02666 [Bryopsis sp. KO-2023]
MGNDTPLKDVTLISLEIEKRTCMITRGSLCKRSIGLLGVNTRPTVEMRTLQDNVMEIQAYGKSLARMRTYKRGATEGYAEVTVNGGNGRDYTIRRCINSSDDSSCHDMMMRAVDWHERIPFRPQDHDSSSMRDREDKEYCSEGTIWGNPAGSLCPSSTFAWMEAPRLTAQAEVYVFSLQDERVATKHDVALKVMYERVEAGPELTKNVRGIGRTRETPEMVQVACD